jgi:capsid protein
MLAAVRYNRMPTEAAIHWFRLDRPAQVRGITEIMSFRPLFAQLRSFTLAVIAAALATYGQL